MNENLVIHRFYLNLTKSVILLLISMNYKILVHSLYKINKNFCFYVRRVKIMNETLFFCPKLANLRVCLIS